MHKQTKIHLMCWSDIQILKSDPQRWGQHLFCLPPLLILWKKERRREREKETCFFLGIKSVCALKSVCAQTQRQSVCVCTPKHTRSTKVRAPIKLKTFSLQRKNFGTFKTTSKTSKKHFEVRIPLKSVCALKNILTPKEQFLVRSKHLWKNKKLFF